MSLSRYVPWHTVHRLARDPRLPVEASVDRFPAALLFADISGFSALTEQLAAQGADGAESISDCLNTYFGQLIAIVTEYGGDVVKFAGDALLALWPAESMALDEATRLAAQCALTVQTRLHDLEVGSGVRMSLRITLDAGDCALVQLGGVLGRWELLVTGEPFRRIASMRPYSEPGRVAATTQAFTLARPHIAGVVGAEPAVMLQGVTTELQAPATRRITPDAPTEAALRAYIPGVVLAREAAGLADWLGEVRSITVLFVTLPPIDDTSSEAVLALQHLVSTTQSLIYRFDGSINKIAVDEKGAVLVAAFGLPPLAHEDDPARGVQAALLVREALSERGVSTRIGVTTGVAFCGSIGNATRAEYTMIGPAVNLAARLMEHAKDSVVCDERTYLLSREALGFTALAPVLVKGKAEPVAIYAPTGERRHVVRQKTAMVGRLAERTELGECLQSVIRGRATSAAIVVGEPGIGKSRLLWELVPQAHALSIRTLLGAADAIDSSTPYRAWRSVFTTYFELQSVTDAEAMRGVVMQRLNSTPELQAHAALHPLLNAVLPVDFADTPFTAQMSGEVRANNTRVLLMALLQHAASARPTVLVVEDAHWFDTQTWALLLLAIREVTPLAVVVTSRPLPTPAPREYAEIVALAGTHVVQVQPLSRDDTENLIRQRLGVREIPERVVDAIYERAGGNALFIEELASALLDTGRLVVSDDVCRLATQTDDLKAQALPATIQGVVTTRVDRLSPAQQLLLKLASVMGRGFYRTVLMDAFVRAGGTSTVSELIATLLTLDIIRVDGPEVDGRYVFKHALTQEAVYSLMLVSQRRDLHRLVAEVNEARGAGDDHRMWSTLAYHWEKAENRARAMDYLERAGVQALASFANEEAITLFNRALTLAMGDTTVTDERLGAWHKHLAEAKFRNGNLSGCRESGQIALRAVGRPVPSSLFGTAMSLFKQIGLRMLQRWFPDRFRIDESEERARRLSATNVQNRLTEVAVYREDALGCLDSGFRELNIAEPAGDSGEVARAYAALSVVLGTVPLHGLCRTWTERALAIAERVQDPTALAYVLSRIAIYDLYVGNWAQGEPRLRRAAEISRVLGDRRLREESCAILGKTLFYSGGFEHSERVWADVQTSSRYSKSRQTYSWSLFGQSESLLRLGRPAEAVPMLMESLPWVAEHAMVSEAVWCHGLLALAHFRAGDKQRAREVAFGILPKIVGVRPVAYWTQQSIAAVSEVLIALWANGDAEAGVQAKKVVKNMRAFAKYFPFGEPHAHLWTGAVAAQAGDKTAAVAHFEAAIAAATRLHTPYEHGRALLEQARLWPAPSAERDAKLSAARAVLEPLGSGWEVDAA